MNNFMKKYPETAKTAGREIWGTLIGGGGSGASIAIMEKGEIVYSEGFGVADREENRSIDKNTRFDIASLSKIFTTAAVMKLVDMDKVDIDLPLCNYIADFEMTDPRYKDITPRMLFNHSAGLMGSCYNQAFCHDLHPSYQKHVLDTMKYSHLKHDPGEKSSYCNDGFTLCEILVERVSGQKYIDFLYEHILKPLEIYNTGESVGTINCDNIAEIYEPTSRKRVPREVSPGVGMGGISSTPEDICRFGQSFCKNSKIRVLSEKSLKEMLSPQPAKFHDKLRTRQEDQFMGWDVNGMEKYEKQGINILMKGGLTWYASKFIVLPDLDVSMAISFAGPGPSTRPALAILDAFLVEKGYKPFKKPIKKAIKPQPIPAEIKRYAGYYSNGRTLVQVLFDSKDGCSIKQLTGEETVTKFIYNDGSFYKKDEHIPYYFTEGHGISFFVAENEHCADLAYQKLDYANTPIQFDWDIDGKIWLNYNIDYSQSNWNRMFVTKSVLCKEVPGYVEFGCIAKIESGNYASATGTYFRDQREILLKEENGILTAYVTDFIMRPEECAGTISAGFTEITIPQEGFATVWSKTDDDLIISINIDKGVSVQALAPDGKKYIFNNKFMENEFFAPKGSYIACFGKRSGTVSLKAE